MPRGSKPKVYPEELVAKVKSLYESGKTQVEVALCLGVSQKVIWRLMLRSGLTSRKPIVRNQIGSLNKNWRGGDASYKAFHNRMRALKGRPKECQVCGFNGDGRTYDWANLTGRYDDPSDYRRMCRSCHAKYDMKQNNLGSYCGKKRAENNN